MRSLARLSFALFGLALAVPIPAGAGEEPPYVSGGYGPAAAAPAPAPIDPAVPTTDTPADSHGHQHAKGSRHLLCVKCMKKHENQMPPAGTIVGCAHSSNGVCPACQQALAMPGPMVRVDPNAPPGVLMTNSGEAPGRAVVGDQSPGLAVSGGYGPAADPLPIGVVQANYQPQQGGPGPRGPIPANVRMTGAVPPGMTSPSRSAPMQSPGAANRPHILGHLFGWSNIGREWRDDRDRRNRESHASISYGAEGKTPVGELPASMVYGKGH